jgi:PTS system beta-glucosides-specific IIC component
MTQRKAQYLIKYLGGPANIDVVDTNKTGLDIRVHQFEHIDSDALAMFGELRETDDDGQYLVSIVMPQSIQMAAAMKTVLARAEQSKLISNHISSKRKILFYGVRMIADSFTSMMPALISAGLVGALAGVLRSVNLVSTESEAYRILLLLAQAPLFFVPFMLAVSFGGKLRINRYITMAVVATIISPQILGNTFAIHIFGDTLKNSNYMFAIVPVIGLIVLQAWIEPKLIRWCPVQLGAIAVPVIEYIFLFLVYLIVWNPIATLIGDGLVNLAVGMTDSQIRWIMCAIFAGSQIFLVATGVHQSLMPLSLAIFSVNGQDSVFGIATLCANLALAGACLASASRNRDGMTLSAGVTALFGITEPAIYGVAFAKRSVLVASVCSAFFSGLIGGSIGITSAGMAPVGIASLILFSGPSFLWALLIGGMALVGGFGLCYWLDIVYMRRHDVLKAF